MASALHRKHSLHLVESSSATDLNIDTPPLFMSSDLNEVGGSARAVQRKALAIDLCVMTR